MSYQKLKWKKEGRSFIQSYRAEALGFIFSVGDSKEWNSYQIMILKQGIPKYNALHKHALNTIKDAQKICQDYLEAEIDKWKK